MQKILKYSLIFSIFLFLFLGFFHEISAITQDLGRHFLLGKIILETHQVPLTNLFSYTYPNFPFINLHWFSEIIFYLIFKFAGYDTLLLFTVLTVSLSFALIFFKSLKKGNIISVAIISILYLGVLFERTDIRPEIFSFLFLSIFIAILYSYREKFTKWIFILPLLILLWVNMHIYFIAGIAILGLFLLDEIVIKRKEIFLSLKKSKRPPAHLTTLIFILLISFTMTAFNPNGINGALYPFRVFENYGYAIEENQNVFFLWNLMNKTTILFFFISASALILSVLLTIKKIKPVDLLLAVFFTYLAVSAERNFPLFVFGTFIAFSNSLSLITEKLFLKIQPLAKLNIFKSIISILLLSIIFWQIFNIINQKKVGFGVQKGAKDAADFFLSNNLEGPLFNNFDIGGYLDYRFYPKEKVFVDNRPGEYPASFFQNVYIPMQSEQDKFNNLSKTYNFNVIFFGHTDQTPWGKTFIKQIISNPNWKTVYLDDFVIILVKNSYQNKNLIDKFEINEGIYQTDYNKFDTNSLYRFLNVFYLISWKKQEIKIYQAILSKDPNSCLALSNLAQNFINENNPSANIFIARFNRSCK
ncbi:MAG: hypothetical protein Q8P10_02440 [bacterium]|nr:hypothetical protein [bacterium]